VCDSQPNAHFDFTLKFCDDRADANLLLCRHASPRGIHAAAEVDGLLGVTLAVADEGQELTGERQVFLLRVD
jgi:hypothetical protein